MARGIHRLSAAEVRTKTEPGHYSDGGGLYLQVSRFDSTKSWVFKFTLNGRTRGMGIGPIHTLSLAEARAKAADLRKVVAEGKDPIEERNAARLKAAIDAAKTITFNDAIDKYLAKKDGEFRNEKHRKQWRSTLDTYAAPVLGKMNIAHIAMPDVLRVLEPIWAEKTETASRLRGRVEAVLSWATVAGFRTGDNPAQGFAGVRIGRFIKVAAKGNQYSGRADKEYVVGSIGEGNPFCICRLRTNYRT